MTIVQPRPDLHTVQLHAETLDELELKLECALEEVRDQLAARNTADWPDVEEDGWPGLHLVSA